jgi:hypothetical protein
MPPSPNATKSLELFRKISERRQFSGHEVTIFVNYFNLLHSFSWEYRRAILMEKWNTGTMEFWVYEAMEPLPNEG